MAVNKLAVITGGSKGLGAALCMAYLDEGYRVLEFSRSGAADYHITVDLADPQTAQTIFSEHLSRLSKGRYDEVVAVNNAGVLAPIGPGARKPAADVMHNLNVNVESQIMFVRAFLQSFQQHDCKKTLVNISSGAALKGYSGWSLYCASKAALENFMRAIAMEQEDEQFPVTAVNIDPYIMDTDMQATIRESSSKDFPTLQRFVDFKQIGALRKPSEVAAIILRMIDGQPASGERLSVAEVEST